jgi:hypothetical protein
VPTILFYSSVDKPLLLGQLSWDSFSVILWEDYTYTCQYLHPQASDYWFVESKKGPRTLEHEKAAEK